MFAEWVLRIFLVAGLVVLMPAISRGDSQVRDSKQTFSQVVLDDFKELQEAGITHPDIEKIKALLTAKADAP